MSRNSDLLTAVTEGWNPEVEMASGYHDTLGACFMTVGMPPSGSTLTFTPKVEEGVTAEARVIPSDGSESTTYTLTDQVEAAITIPPNGSGYEVLFVFEGQDVTPESDILGSMVFTDYTVLDSTIQGDLLKFTSTEGVRILTHSETYPIYGNTIDILSADSGILTPQGLLTLGTD